MSGLDSTNSAPNSQPSQYVEAQRKWSVIMYMAVTLCCLLYVVDYFTAAKSRIEAWYMKTPYEKRMDELMGQIAGNMPDLYNLPSTDAMKRAREAAKTQNAQE